MSKAVIDADSCIGCEACVSTCPSEAIKMNDEGKAFVDEEACIECGSCVSACPAEAISQ